LAAAFALPSRSAHSSHGVVGVMAIVVSTQAKLCLVVAVAPHEAMALPEALLKLPKCLTLCRENTLLGRYDEALELHARAAKEVRRIIISGTTACTSQLQTRSPPLPLMDRWRRSYVRTSTTLNAGLGGRRSCRSWRRRRSWCVAHSASRGCRAQLSHERPPMPGDKSPVAHPQVKEIHGILKGIPRNPQAAAENGRPNDEGKQQHHGRRTDARRWLDPSTWAPDRAKASAERRGGFRHPILVP
jgi:hypothetical protein